MEQQYRRSCGIDVHKKNVTVCVLAPAGKPEAGIKRRTFRTFTRDLKQLRAWLKNCKVTEIAMESTGQYCRTPVRASRRRTQTEEGPAVQVRRARYFLQARQDRSC
jgi:transposase